MVYREIIIEGNTRILHDDLDKTYPWAFRNANKLNEEQDNCLQKKKENALPVRKRMGNVVVTESNSL